MRPQKILDVDMLTGLSQVFRSKGYEGASLNDLSEATGLKKASLYHRFPNGKQEMAEAVFRYMEKWVVEKVFIVMKDESLSPEERLKNGLQQIQILYNGGKDMCIFRAFSMEVGLDLFERNIEHGMKGWVNAFTGIGISFQLSPKIAKENAIQALIEIQGSLVLTKALKDVGIFENALKNIEKRYLQ